jgi:hypothetical protein
MRRIVSGCLVALALALAATSARGSESVTGIGGCKLMSSALRAWGGTWPHVLTVHDFETTADPSGAHCTWNEAPGPPTSGLAHHLTLAVYIAPSAAAAHAEVRKFMVPPEPVVVRGTGADEVHAKSTHGSVGTFTRASWRKGRYWGKILLSGPGPAGDLDDLKELLVQFVRRLARA